VLINGKVHKLYTCKYTGVIYPLTPVVGLRHSNSVAGQRVNNVEIYPTNVTKYAKKQSQPTYTRLAHFSSRDTQLLGMVKRYVSESRPCIIAASRDISVHVF